MEGSPGMNRFTALFQDKNRKVFIPFFTLGDPNRAASMDLIKATIDAGVQALELGMPFSDPVADGPTNQRSMERALKAGATFDVCLDMLREIRAPKVAIGLLMYYNLIHRSGMDKACRDLKAAGVDALLAADVPLEESAELEAVLAKNDIGFVHFIAPNTPDDRIAILDPHITGYYYVLSGYGVTGAKKDIDPRTIDRVKHIRRTTEKPLVVGFGISDPAHVHAIWNAGANAAIVGSKFSSLIETNLTDLAKAKDAIVAFTKAVKIS
jgi:tryptophan synthase alpha chain